MSERTHTSNTLGYMRGYFRLKRENEMLRIRVKQLKQDLQRIETLTLKLEGDC